MPASNWLLADRVDLQLAAGTVLIYEYSGPQHADILWCVCSICLTYHQLPSELIAGITCGIGLT